MSEIGHLEERRAHEENALVHTQNRHDGDIRRSGIGSKVADHFGVPLTAISRFSTGRLHVPFNADASRSEVTDWVVLNVRGLFEPDQGFSVKQVVVANAFLENGGSISFSPWLDTPLDWSDVRAVVAMQAEIDELTLPPAPEPLLPAA